MALPVGVFVAIGLVLLVILVLLLLGMRGRGRLIECPECGAQFKRPAFAEKATGFGVGLPGIGDFTCPKCNYRTSTSNFRYVNEKESNPKDSPPK